MSARRRNGSVPIAPFRDWLGAELARLEADETVERPTDVLARRLTNDDEHGGRYLYRWLRGLDGSDRPTRLIRFLTVAEVLHNAGVDFSELYPRWCSACGRHAPGAIKTGLCWSCYQEAGGHRGRAHRSTPQKMSEDLMVRARALYEEHGWSFRRIAERLVDQTGYANAHVMAVQLNVQANRRGWRVRDRTEATVAASTKHGLSPRKKVTEEQRRYRRLRRIRSGEIRGVRCEATTASGRQCKRAALRGGRFCIAHDPERGPAHARQMYEARKRKEQR